MMASHFLARSAGMIPVKPVLSNSALTFAMRFVTSVAMSMSEPTGLLFL